MGRSTSIAMVWHSKMPAEVDFVKPKCAVCGGSKLDIANH